MRRGCLCTAKQRRHTIPNYTITRVYEQNKKHLQLDEAEQDVLYEIDQHKAGINQRHRELELLRKQIDTAQLVCSRWTCLILILAVVACTNTNAYYSFAASQVQQQHHQKRVQLGMRGRELNSNSKVWS